MTKISRETTREQLAGIVVGKLREHSIDATLVGGSVVSFYTANRYESHDLDFISSADHKRIASAMIELGFAALGKDFVHDATDFTVEFPTGPLGIGDDQPVLPEGRMMIDGVEVKMLSPTQSVMDRLAGFFWFNDRQCLDQAIWIAESQAIDLERVAAWAGRERQEDKVQAFLKRLGK